MFFASALVILAGIAFFLATLFAVMALILPHQPPVFRALIFAVPAVPLLVLSSLALRDTSILWQIPLQSFAAATATVGAVALVSLSFHDWHLLFGSIGLRAATSLVIGLVLGWVMRRLQARFLPAQDA